MDTKLKKVPKIRLDALLKERFPDLSRNQIQSYIIQGRVSLDGEKLTKTGTAVPSDAPIVLKLDDQRFVSRGGLKLEAALRHFNLDVTDMIALDAGISTGGFTDCLLQRGAKKVYGVDVALGQVHQRVATDPRVTLLEKTNLRHLTNLPELVDLASLDVSFISLKKVIPAVAALLKPGGYVLALIKPQFEAERSEISRGGLVKSDEVHMRIIEEIKNCFATHSLTYLGIMDSPILGASSGNKEFLGFFQKMAAS